MRLIFGIGNPGEKYQGNRHNVGFKFLDYLANKYAVKFGPSKMDYYYSESKIGELDYCLIKPSTFVNNSGFSALQAIEQYNLSIDDVLVVYDDIYLPVGTFRIKLSGGDGGHNGIASIIYQLASDQFARIRIGVGNLETKLDSRADYVLSDFNRNEIKLLEKVFEDCFILIEAFISGGTKGMLDKNSQIANISEDSGSKRIS